MDDQEHFILILMGSARVNSWEGKTNFFNVQIRHFELVADFPPFFPFRNNNDGVHVCPEGYKLGFEDGSPENGTNFLIQVQNVLNQIAISDGHKVQSVFLH